MLLDAEAAAGRTGAIGIVEGEQPRLDFRNREAGDRAGEFFREQNPFRPALVMDLCDFLRRGLILRDGVEPVIGPRFARTRWRLLRMRGKFLMLRSTAKAVRLEARGPDHRLRLRGGFGLRLALLARHGLFRVVAGGTLDDAGGIQ